MPREVAVVLQQHGHAVLEPGLAHAPHGGRVLVLGDRRRGHAAAARAGGVQRQRAPARADLQQVVGRLQVELVVDQLELGHRGLLERHPRPLEQRAGVHHRRVEHPLEEVVAEVVVGLDVLARAPRRVAHERLARAQVRLAHRGEPAARGVELVDVAGGDAQHGGQVRGVPEPLRVGLGEPAPAVQQVRPQLGREDLHRRRGGARAELVADAVLDDGQAALADLPEQAERDAAGGGSPHAATSGRRCHGTPLSLSRTACA